VRRQQAACQGAAATGADSGPAAGAASTGALDLGSTFYMLNPSGDLAMTQAAFEERFASLPGWEVCACSSKWRAILEVMIPINSPWAAGPPMNLRRDIMSCCSSHVTFGSVLCSC
jgi:hypothetical protein